MDINACIRKIDRYLAHDNMQPMIVDVQNRADLSELITHYNVGSNAFVAVSGYCKPDEYPNMEELLDALSSRSRSFFVTGITAFLKLRGEQVLRDTLHEMLGMSPAGHVVIFTFQCGQYLNGFDPRIRQRVAIVDGEADRMVSLVFSSQQAAVPGDMMLLRGIDRIGEAAESCAAAKLYIDTKKLKSDYPNSMFVIEELGSAYDLVAYRDRLTADLCEDYGSDEQWSYVLSKFQHQANWAELVDSEFGNHRALDIVFSSLGTFDADKRWLYFIALKLFGARANWCLDEAVRRASSVQELPRQIYRSLLDVSKDNPAFEDRYLQRKTLIAYLGESTGEVIDYCRIVQAKGKDAIYYLTDSTQSDKELIFELLDRYADDYTREEVGSALKLVYPALYHYLSAYGFKNDLLDSYFQDYKYQKVINRVLPEFDKVVTEQALKREYKLILPARSSKVEAIDRTGAQLYFVDAMGVEYLGYIMSVCAELGLMANVMVCSCELPSITSKNKEFLELFENEQYPNVSIKEIDDIKHHGKDNFDYQQTKLPIHLMQELEVIRGLLEKIRGLLASDIIKKAVLISDHGASRLAVIHETECIWEMASRGEHSGRCCLKTDIDAQPEYAVDAGDFWSLANYDRFKGGRKANVEVHGGATLEEVTVPIIELTCMPRDIEVHILPIDAGEVMLDGTPEITVSYRKKAALRIFATAKLEDVSIKIDEKLYDAIPDGDGFYIVEMPDIKEAKTYHVDVYACGNRVAQELPLRVKKEGSTERELL